ncbi:MAG: hypothetical protein V8Q17_08130 [Acutalibacteraceae bacterium]
MTSKVGILYYELKGERKMNSPYMGRFQITQAYTSEHDGLDLVGLDNKQIHSTVNGTVIHAGWENPSNHSQGFGLYVCIRVGKPRLLLRSYVTDLCFCRSNCKNYRYYWFGRFYRIFYR